MPPLFHGGNVEETFPEGKQKDFLGQPGGEGQRVQLGEMLGRGTQRGRGAVGWPGAGGPWSGGGGTEMIEAVAVLPLSGWGAREQHRSHLCTSCSPSAFATLGINHGKGIRRRKTGILEQNNQACVLRAGEQSVCGSESTQRCSWHGRAPTHPQQPAQLGGRSGRGLPRAARCAADPPGAVRALHGGLLTALGLLAPNLVLQEPAPCLLLAAFPCPHGDPPELLPLGSPGSELQGPAALHRRGFGGEGTIRFTGFGLQVLPTCSSVS